MIVYADRLKLYDHIVDQIEGLERKGKTMPYTSDNGYMFSLLNKEAELGIRLPKKRALEIMNEYGATEFRSHGAKMREYIQVPHELLSEEKLLVDWIKEGWAYVKRLPPK